MTLPPDEPPIPPERPETPRRPRTIEELMGELADGNDEALGALFDAIAPCVRRYLSGRIAPDRVDVTVKTIMLEIHRARGGYAHDTNVLTLALSFAQCVAKDAGYTSKLDQDVRDLVHAGLHVKDVATILDTSPTKVREAVERQHQFLQSLLAENVAKVPAARRCPVTPNATDLVGTVIDRYRIEDLIGSGGFGNVYRATEIGAAGEVAIKVMREIPGEDRSGVESFKREARTMRAFAEHPNIVEIRNQGELPDGRAWYAMGLLHGRALDELVGRETRFSWSRVARLVGQLCSALKVVHAADVVHGDVKPANCFVTDVGLPTESLCLLDFGLAKRTASGDSGTVPSAGAIDGTARYLAPELLSGRAADRRADIYAIGVMMFEMLTGRSPFEAGNFESLVIEKRVKQMPTLADCAPEARFSRGMQAIVRRAMHPDPAQRFASVESLAAAIAALGPTGQRRTPWTTLDHDARVRLVATASISALLASLVTAWFLAGSPKPLPWVPQLTPDHITAAIEAARPSIDACRTGDAPDTAKLRVLGKTGQVIDIVELAESPSSDCIRDVLETLRFPRFETAAGQVEIEVEL